MNLLFKYIYRLLVVYSTLCLLLVNVMEGGGHMMAGFDLHSVCARCHDKKKGEDACVEKPDSECQHCKVLTLNSLLNYPPLPTN